MFNQRTRLAATTAQQCLQTRRQFAQIKRLDQVIIGTALQAINAVLYRVPGSEDQYRRSEPGVAPLAKGLAPIMVRQPQIQH